MAMFEIHAVDEQIKALPTVDTASGSIATFDTDMTENLVEVKCQIVAQQSGSGTPSPSNPRPITPYSEMNVSHTGKNLFDTNAFISAGATVVDDVYTIAAGIPSGTIINIPLPKNTTLTFSYKAKYLTNNCDYYIMVRYTDGTYTRDIHATTADTWEDYHFTTDNTKTIKEVALGVYASSRNTQFKDLQIELGSTATAFILFNGTTANIPFGQTVAQGLLNVGTGKLRVTHGVVDLGSLNYTQQASTATYQDFSNAALASLIKPPSDVFGIIDGMCSVFRLASRNDQSGTPTDNLNTLGVAGSGTIRIVTPPNEYATPTDLKTALNGQLLVYELATPIDIQLDSITLQALLNENNIWCDTGDTSVKYILSVGKAIS